jgi:hypothetical protein
MGRLLFFFLPVFFLTAVLQAEEDPGNWYLISEAELRSIERYRETSEAEKQNWLSQAQTLRAKAASSEARSERLERESAGLNRQLRTAREAQGKSEQLYEQSETEKLTLLSSKNGEIAGLKDEVAAERLRAEKYKGEGRTRLVMVIALAGAWGLYLAYKVCRGLRVIPG